MDKLDPKPRYMKINPTRFNISTLPKMATSGIITDWNGINMAATNTSKRIPLNLLVFRASAYPAMEEKMIIIVTLIPVINSELNNELTKFKSINATTKFSMDSDSGSPSTFVKISFFDLNAFTIIIYNGVNHNNPRMIPNISTP